jgi:hypothetical protein
MDWGLPLPCRPLTCGHFTGVGIEGLRLESRFGPVGAGVGLGVVGTPCGVRRPRPVPTSLPPPSRATQASPLPIHTTPAPTGNPVLPPFSRPFFFT